MSVKIFLSTVTDEFRDYRDRLRGDLTRHNVEVKVQEDFKDYGGSTLDMLDQYIKTCDAVIHLVGDMTGAEPVSTSTLALLAKYPDIVQKLPPLRKTLEQGQAISYTQWEAWLALYHGKLLFIAEADEATQQRGPNYNPTDSSRAAQREHLERLREAERFGRKFSNPDNLANIILSGAILDLLVKSQQAEAPAALPSLPYPAIIAILFLLLATPLAAEELAKTLGISVATPIVLAGAAGGLALALVYWRYLGILGNGAASCGSLERQAYDTLRESLVTGGRAVDVYSLWLTAFLDGVDRFFGDASNANRTLFPHAFGLRTRAPLWTAPAFDRCLLLALVYPIVTIFLMWAISGHVGPAEQALGLPPGLLPWQRGIVITSLLFCALLMQKYIRSKGWFWPTLWLLIPAVIGPGIASIAVGWLGALESEVLVPFIIYATGALVVTGIFAIAVAMGFPNVVARNVALDLAGAVIIASAVVSGLLGLAAKGHVASNVLPAFITIIAIAGCATGSGSIAVSVAAALAMPIIAQVIVDALNGSTGYLQLVSIIVVIVFAGGLPVALGFIIALLRPMTERHGWQGIFLLVLMCLLIVGCLISVHYLDRPGVFGPVGLFIGLLTLLNAPFDWASLGLTRALLRRGLELQGWWPFLLALVDALTAGVIVALLALTMVIGVQAFDERSVMVLNLDALFNGIGAQPGSPEFWWVYVLLLSTMIPSLVNLIIGGTALARTVPGLPSLILRHLPADRAVPVYDRAWIALVLTLQAAGGIVLGIAAQALLVVVLILYAMPAVGLGLLSLARDVAAFDLPGRILSAF